MKIRAAALSDHKELTHLSKVLGYPIEEEVLIEGLKSILAEEDHLLLVAEIKGKAVGMIEAQPYSTVYSAGQFFNVLGLVVDDQVQKQGVGGKLLSAIEEEARQRGMQGIRLNSNVKRHAAHRFYENHGYHSSHEQKRFIKEL